MDIDLDFYEGFDPFAIPADDWFDGDEGKAGGIDRNRGNAEVLRRYWTRGPGGARIMWRTPGDFTRCVVELREHLGRRAEGYCANRHKEMNGYWPGDRRNRKDDGGGTMDDTKTALNEDPTAGLEFKNVSVAGLTVDDDAKGTVTAIVSVTGVKDNVNDVIEPGAYTKTLDIRTPKGAWSHQWETPTARTLDAKELMPGDNRLPKRLPNGEKWPAEAGALLVKMQFNLETQRGREAYSDVKFFGQDQEWSIGYRVPVGGSTQVKGVRHIQTLDLYEYSPVLFGAMPAARTASVKEAQMAWKSLSDIQVGGDAVSEELPEDEAKDAQITARLAAAAQNAIKALQSLVDAAQPEMPEGDGEEKDDHVIRAQTVADAWHEVFTKSGGDTESQWFTDGAAKALAVDGYVATKDYEGLDDGIDELKAVLEESDADNDAADAFLDAVEMYAEAVKMDDDADDDEDDEDLEDLEDDEDEDDEEKGVQLDFEGLTDFLSEAEGVISGKSPRTFRPERRRELAEHHEAMPDGSFPIPDKGALRRAIQSIGRAKDPEAVKRFIRKRAKELDAEEMIPDSWNG